MVAIHFGKRMEFVLNHCRKIVGMRKMKSINHRKTHKNQFWLVTKKSVIQMAPNKMKIIVEKQAMFEVKMNAKVKTIIDGID